LGVLASAKRLRGTPFDLFGYTHERRTERQLIRDYEALVEELIAKLTPQNHATAVGLAGLAQKIAASGTSRRGTWMRRRRRRRSSWPASVRGRCRCRWRRSKGPGAPARVAVRVVLDTSVVVSAFRSRRGASFALMRAVAAGKLTLVADAALVLAVRGCSEAAGSDGGVRLLAGGYRRGAG
jgi:anti-sigma factor ChrR (cupin superfamily)